jgi:hydroxymethylpyrimidine/phosphomethylpyrimidine kinase
LAARNLSAEHDTAVLITGVPDSDKRVDVLVEQGVVTLFSAETIATNNTHGSGDTLSAAIAANLAHGHDLPTAIKRANTFTRAAIRAAAMQQLGSSSGQSHGHGPLWYSLKPLAS